MSDNEKHLGELLKSSQKVMRRQQKEIEALRATLDSINKEDFFCWDDMFEGISSADNEWPPDKIIKREA